MTTPQRLKRRQMIEGTALLILGVFTVLITMYFRAEDVEQRECVAKQIAAIGKTFTVRASLAEDESSATRQVIRESLTAQSREDLEKARDTYFLELGRIDAARARAKIPPFPPGTCDQ